MSISFPGWEKKDQEEKIRGPKCNGQRPSKAAALTCLTLGCVLLLLSLKSIGNVPLTSLTAGSGLWVCNRQQENAIRRPIYFL